MSTAGVIYLLVASLHYPVFFFIAFAGAHRIRLTVASVLAVLALAFVWPFVDLALLVSMARAVAKETR